MKTLSITIVIVLSMISIFIFGIIWLSKGFDVEDRIIENQKYVMKLIKELEIKNSKNIEDFKIRIMPSAFIGRK